MLVQDVITGSRQPMEPEALSVGRTSASLEINP